MKLIMSGLLPHVSYDLHYEIVESYLRADKIIDIAKSTKSKAIHPG
jgi:pyruvate carboxylase